jgi:tight adherence protein B
MTLMYLLALPVISGLFLLCAIRYERRRQFVQQRLHALTVRTGTPIPELSLRRALRQAASLGAFLPKKIRVRLDAAFEATGNRIRLLHLPIAGSIAAAIVIVFSSRMLALNSALVLLIGFVAALTIPAVLLRYAQSRYRSRFLDVFPDALDMVGRGIKAGLPVNEALVVAGQEIAEPVGRELRHALAQVQVGVPMIDALEATANRVRVADFRFMVVALSLQQKTGGSLAETLANLSGVLRARKALRLKTRALSAEAKVSAFVLAALPFLIGGAMYVMNRDLTRTLFFDPRGRFMLGVAFVSLVTGLIVMAVLVKKAMR